MTNEISRQQEATETRAAAAAEFHVRAEDKKMYGTTDWYIVWTMRNRMTIRRERDIKAGEVTLLGPYFTESQARDERPYSLAESLKTLTTATHPATVDQALAMLKLYDLSWNTTTKRPEPVVAA